MANNTPHHSWTRLSGDARHGSRATRHALTIASASHDAPDRLAAALEPQLRSAAGHMPINVVAIGSDRTTGDCLGPIVGEYLASSPRFNVYGTLVEPVHAANLAAVAPLLRGFTIAIDAALGDPVGDITVHAGGIAPGAAFDRDLDVIGDCSVSAHVCDKGPLGFERLRSVRLGFVRDIARVIASGIALAADAEVPIDVRASSRPLGRSHRPFAIASATI